MSVDEQLFYIRDSRSDVGSSAMFWMHEGAGYTSDLTKAWKVPREKAIAQHNSRETDIPVRCDLADAHSYLAVDCQLVDAEKLKPVAGGKRVYQVPKSWDGNNIEFFRLFGGGGTFDYGQAYVASEEDRVFGVITLDKAGLDKIARPVVKAEHVETRMVLRRARIKMNPYLLAKNNRRQDSGKHRSNCPTCGRIVWDYNPHEPIYCNEHRSY